MSRINVQLSTVVTIVLIAVTAAYLVESLDYTYWLRYGPGPGFIPRWAGCIMLGLLILSLCLSFKEQGTRLADTFPKGHGGVNLIIAWASLIWFVAVAKTLGFTITSVAMLTALFGRNIKWQTALALSLIVSLCCLFIFKSLLQVPVPVNRFGW